MDAVCAFDVTDAHATVIFLIDAHFIGAFDVIDAHGVHLMLMVCLTIKTHDRGSI